MIKRKSIKISPRQVLGALVIFTALVVFKSCDSAKDSNTSNESTEAMNARTERMPEVIDFNQHIRPILSDRCYVCHGPDANKRESGYRLDIQEDAYKALKDKPDVFGIVPGHSDQSAVVERMNSTDPNLVMPPPASNLSLTEREIALITKWIDQGAEWKKHWSFIPLAEVAIPNPNTDWGNNNIDSFIAQKLDEKGFEPSASATRNRLLRRMSFDLTGLPPSEALSKAFLTDESMSFETLVDELMKSPNYGEHMATTWLDLARYSDSHGYQDDLERIMWPWRDWVISAFNRKMPYDQFVTWQLAGDMLPNATKEQILATGFNRNHKITQEGGVIDEEYRVEYVTDRANTFGKAFLGLTTECAKCHDHKYDPISQKDYFSLYSFFNSVPEKGRIEYDEIPEPNLKITEKDLEGILSFVNAQDFRGEDLRVMVMADSSAKRPSYILTRGQYDLHGEPVTENTPSSIKDFDTYSKDRLGLSKWLFARDNPLTARVTVNRIWQSFFRQGLVKTTDDFGNQGSLPTHPELLDYLAYEFMESGWDMQALQKKILLSAAYQQSSKVSPQLLELDPENAWITRGPRYRMSFEMIRDNALALSGLLNTKVGGPSVKPYQPEGLWAETTSGIGLTNYIPDEGEALYRRSLYTFWKRTVPPPTMMTFDGASRDFCEVKRQKTNTPLQALVLMNDPQLLEAARVFAYSILEKEMANEERLPLIFERVLGRKGTSEELTVVESFFQIELERFQEDEQAMKDYLSIGAYPQKIVNAEAAAYMSVISTVFNLDEAISKT